MTEVHTEDSGPSSMDCEGNELPGVRVANTASVNSSPDWTEASSGARGSRRRQRAAVTPPDSARVLRARAVVPGGDNDSQDRAAGSRSRNAPVTQADKKNPRANKTPKQVVGPKPSKGREDKRRSHPKASCSTLVTTFKSEPETEASSYGEDICDAEEMNGKSRCQTSFSQTEVKKEECDEEEEEDECSEKEGSSQAVMQSEDGVGDKTDTSRKRSRQDDKAPRQPKRRKKLPVQYVRCEMEGCGAILAHPRYLQHHMKYQHLLKKKFVCDHPSCGRLFRLQKQLLRHAKHHSDQRDYICEYCARAFKSSYNLAVHKMIHTGEKPIQCEICGFTCRQKASLNWHMKKHDAEASYQFSCSICGKKFEKKDSVVAHKAKIHPKVLIAEDMAAIGGSVMAVSVPAVSREKEADGTLTPLQQVVLPLHVQTQVGQFHQVQVENQQEDSTLMHLNSSPPAQIYSSPPQLIQPSPLQSSTETPANSQSVLLTLSSMTSLAPPHWEGAGLSDMQTPAGDEEWEMVVVGEDSQLEGSEEQRKENDGIIWEREGERQILLECAEVSGDNLM